MARPERFELPTFWFVARRSIQLSYGRAGCAPEVQVGRATAKSLAQAVGGSQLSVAAFGRRPSGVSGQVSVVGAQLSVISSQFPSSAMTWQRSAIRRQLAVDSPQLCAAGATPRVRPEPGAAASVIKFHKDSCNLPISLGLGDNAARNMGMNHGGAERGKAKQCGAAGVPSEAEFSNAE